jgi:hypothetical protein
MAEAREKIQMDQEASSGKKRDRLQTIADLHEERIRKFKELEQMVNPLKDQIQMNFNEMSERVNEIKVKGIY